jgi:hypothetical protein
VGTAERVAGRSTRPSDDPDRCASTSYYGESSSRRRTACAGTAPVLQFDPTTVILSGIATHQCRRLERKTLRIRVSKVVHGVRLIPWLAGLRLPSPECGQGWNGAGLDELHPTTDPVTCHHCLHLTTPRSAPRLVDRAGWLVLDFENVGDAARPSTSRL